MEKYSAQMSVYYKEKPEFLCEAMENIWQQTSTNGFELVCDGPLGLGLDTVIAEMRSSHPGELHIVRLKNNIGLGNVLTIGSIAYKHELMARMDSDDISYPDRCERQLNIFSAYPVVDTCFGTVLELWDNIRFIADSRRLPSSDRELCRFLRKRNSFNYPAVMFRKSTVADTSGYSEEYYLFEDYYLWIRMLKNEATGFNLEEPILYIGISKDFYHRRWGFVYLRYAQIPLVDVSRWLVFQERLRGRRIATRRHLYAAWLYQGSHLQDIAQLTSTVECYVPMEGEVA